MVIFDDVDAGEPSIELLEKMFLVQTFYCARNETSVYAFPNPALLQS